MGAKVVDKCVVGYVHELPSVDGMYRGDQTCLMGKKTGFLDNVTGLKKMNSCTKDDSCSDNESSSIGKNSDLSENSLEKSGDGEEEVQSSYKSPFDAIAAMEDALPIRKSMSRFYNGKSRSFTSLAEASCSSSITEIAKPDNAYTRKRRNLLAHKITFDRSRMSPLRGSGGGGISKRVTGNSGRSTLALAVAMNNSEKDEGIAKCDSAGSFTASSPVKDFCYWKSFSFADLQHCVSVANKCSTPN